MESYCFALGCLNMDGGIKLEENYEEFKIRLGKRIMDLRHRKKFTREYLAEKVDISPKFLYEIEMGKKGCSSYILQRLSNAFGVSLDYLMNNEKSLEAYTEIEEICLMFGNNQKKKISDILRILYDISQEV